MRRLSSELQQLVKSRSLQENKRLQALLQEVRRLSVQAVEAALVKPETRLVKIDSTRFTISSPGENALYDPSLSRSDHELGVEEPGILDIRALTERLNASEIDFTRIRRAIEATLKESGTATLGEVLKKFPATQGLATIVGCLRIALDKAEMLENEKETIEWENRLGERTRARIPLFLFTRSCLDPEGCLL